MTEPTPPLTARETARLTALVLAGGASRRMGRNKSALPVGGTSMLDRTLVLATSVSDELILLAGNAEVATPDGVRRVDDWPAPDGPLGALGAGLEAASHPWCLLLPCDMPFVTPEVIATLQQRAATAGTDVDAVVLVGERGPEPFCALYRTSALDALADAVDAGVDSLRGWLDRITVTALDASAVDPTLAVLTNVNTPADLAAADHGSGSGVTA